MRGEGNGETNSNLGLGTIPKGLIKGIQDLEIRG